MAVGVSHCAEFPNYTKGEGVRPYKSDSLSYSLEVWGAQTSRSVMQREQPSLRGR